ncbi:hypothetical protein D3C78_997850 [compost metagenome]
MKCIRETARRYSLFAHFSNVVGILYISDINSNYDEHCYNDDHAFNHQEDRMVSTDIDVNLAYFFEMIGLFS